MSLGRRGTRCAMFVILIGALLVACDPKPEASLPSSGPPVAASVRRVPSAVVAADLQGALLVVADVRVAGESAVEVAGRTAFERRFAVTNARAVAGGEAPTSFEFTAVSLYGSADRLNVQLPATSLDGWDFVDLDLGEGARACALFVGGPPMSAPRGLGGRTPKVVGGPLDGRPVRALVLSEPELETVLPALVALGREPSEEALKPWLDRHSIVVLDALRRSVRRPIEPSAAASVAALFSRALEATRAPAVKVAALDLADRALGMSEAGSPPATALVDALLAAWKADPAGPVDESWLGLWNLASASHLRGSPSRAVFEAELARRTLSPELEPLRAQITQTLSAP